MRHATRGKTSIASLGVAIAGIAILILLTVWPTSSLYPIKLAPGFFAVIAMAALARALAVRTATGAVMALDAAFYISSVYVFGLLASGWLMVTILSADLIVRYVVEACLSGERGSVSRLIADSVVRSGWPLIGLLIVALGFGIDHRLALSGAQILMVVPLTAAVFFGARYGLFSTLSSRQGTNEEAHDSELLRAMMAELLLVPLTLAMVVGYGYQGLGLYLLLGASCLTFCVVFREATISHDKLQERIEELSVLNKVGRSISASLERRTLFSNLAGETLRLVRHSSRFMIGTFEPRSDVVVYEVFDDSHKGSRRLVAPRDEGLSGWVIQHREPLRLGDVQSQHRTYSKSETYNDPRFHSWLGVPLVIYDEVIGVVSVQSQTREAYTDDHLRVLVTIADQAAVALENSRLYELATIDGLTGLLVRRQFEQRLDEEWARSKRYGSEFALGILDLDSFKALNDTYGHHAGDVALRAAAAVLRGSMRGVDICGRYGGEEFAFVLPRTRLPEAMTMAERIRADIERMRIRSGAADLRLTASIGLVAFPDTRAHSAAELIGLADEAMYRAKSLGKNRVSCGAEPSHFAASDASSSTDSGVV